jgi:arachidonate 15-lipoxygenase
MNFMADNDLIATGGLIDKITVADIEDCQKIAAQSRLGFDFTAQMPDEKIKSRKIRNIKEFPYREDILSHWDLTLQFVTEWTDVVYKTDADVAADEQLQAWAKEITEFGKLKGFPARITSKFQLARLLAMTIVTASAQHAAVNFSQGKYESFIPIMGLGLWGPLVFDRRASASDFERLIAPVPIAQKMLNLATLLSGVNIQRLGEGYEFDNPLLDQVLTRYRYRLDKMEATINLRNTGRKFVYEFLLPSNVPRAISI